MLVKKAVIRILIDNYKIPIERKVLFLRLEHNRIEYCCGYKETNKNYIPDPRCKYSKHLECCPRYSCRLAQRFHGYSRNFEYIPV